MTSIGQFVGGSAIGDLAPALAAKSTISLAYLSAMLFAFPLSFIHFLTCGWKKPLALCHACATYVYLLAIGIMMAVVSHLERLGAQFYS
jgi:hypothetical protein